MKSPERSGKGVAGEAGRAKRSSKGASTASRARARSGRIVVENQVRELVELLASGHIWSTEKDAPVYAARWGKSKSTVTHRVAEASKILRLFSTEERETLRTRWVAFLDGIAHEARRDAGAGDRAAAVAAIRVAADIAGVSVTTHDVVTSSSPWAALPRAERLARMREMVPKLTAAIAATEAEVEPATLTEGGA